MSQGPSPREPYLRERSGPADKPGVGDIMKAISTDVQQLVKHEIELAKAELMPAAKLAGMGSGLLAGAAVFALFALGLIFIGCSLVIGGALGKIWLGFMIMAAGLLVVAGLLGLFGIVQVKKANLNPERTTATATATVNAVKGAITRATTAAKTPAIEPRRD